jgi:hypothetical protein
MVKERRDPVRRAQTLQKVVERLVRHRGVRPSDLVVEQIVPEDSAERILKWLALRGLVRKAADAWEPRAVLLSPATLTIT